MKKLIKTNKLACLISTHYSTQNKQTTRFNVKLYDMKTHKKISQIVFSSIHDAKEYAINKL